jgi:hypothetical protein
MQDARVAVLVALDETPADTTLRGAALREASEKAASVVVEHDTRPAAVAWRAYASALLAGSRLIDWQEAIRTAEPDGKRHLDSAHLIAREALQGLDQTDPALFPVALVLTAMTGVTSPAEVDKVVAELRRVPLPMPVSKPPHAPMSRRPIIEREEVPPEPIAVALFELGGEPAPDTALVHANQFLDLRLQLRLTEWPEWADELHATAISVAGENASFPNFRFPRPEASDHEGLWTVADAGKLVIKAVQRLGDDPLTFTLLVELVSTSDRRRAALRTAGQRELRLWSTDDAPTSFFTASEQLDQRVAEILALISSNDALGPDSERKAFVRFLRGLLRATTSMQSRAVYREVMPDERRFQRDLLVLLDQQDALHSRVQEGTKVGGGETDLVHDGVVAELKVEKATTVTKENATQFIGQTTSYASGLGSQLGIAVILDLSEKKNPLGHPANYLHWLEPKLHGVTDPVYPSHVAILVVNGSVPLPSAFAGKKVEAPDRLGDDASSPGPSGSNPATAS